MNRRDTIVALLAFGTLAEPLALQAQTKKPARIGYLSYGNPATSAPPIEAVKQGMRTLGHIEGTSYVLEPRWAEGKIERLPALAAELVKLPVDVVVAATTPAVLAAQKATTTIPIVMVGVSDPVGDGLVKSLGRPGDNITGIANLVGETGPKLVELLLETVPKLSTVAVMVNAANPAHTAALNTIMAATRTVGLQAVTVKATTPVEIERGLAFAASEKIGAVILVADTQYLRYRREIAELAIKYRLATVGAFSESVEAGSLMSYGANNLAMFRQAATYVDKILKGAKPAALPVEQAARFDLVVNLKTARDIGVNIPPVLLLRADRVIE